MQTRRPTAERREEIARTVLQIIGERGLPALTTSSLAREIGVTSGALFRHFATREDILDEAVRLAVPRIEETFPAASLPPLQRLLELARRRARLLSAEPGLAWLLRSEQAHLSLPADGVKQLEKLVARSRAYLLDAIHEGADAGSIRSDIEPEVLLIPVMGTIHVLAGMTGIHRRAVRDRDREAERVLAGLERMLAPPARPRTNRKQVTATRRKTTRR